MRADVAALRHDASYLAAVAPVAGAAAEVSFRSERISGVQVRGTTSEYLDTSTLKPKIFGFVAGDEMGLYKQHGLIPEKASSPPKVRPKPRLPEGERQRAH